MPRRGTDNRRGGRATDAQAGATRRLTTTSDVHTRRQHRHDWEIGANAAGGGSSGAPDKGRAARLSASARSTGGFNRLRGRSARFAVAQDARGSDPSLATTRNPRNVGFKGLRPQGAFGAYDMVRKGYVLAQQSDRYPHFNSDVCGLGYIFAG